MRSNGVIAAAFACLSTGCLDTQADMPAATDGAAGMGGWDAGAGSVKPPLAQPTAGSAWVIQGGSGGPQQRSMGSQPMAAGSAGRSQAGAAAAAGARRALPTFRADMDAGAMDAAPAEPSSAEPSSAEPSSAEPSSAEQPDAEQPAGAGPSDAAQHDPGELDASRADALVERPGDLIITELMIDPKALSDAEGEWIELYNASEHTLELRDCQLDDGDESLHAIPPARVEPGAYFTLAREPEPGFSADLSVPLSLTNSADSIAIVCQGHEIDRVSYDKAAEFVIKSGVSLALDPEQLDASANDSASAWCEGKGEYTTDLGTPGHANPSCQGEHEPDASDASEAGQGQGEWHDESEPEPEAEQHDGGVADAGASAYDAGTYDAAAAAARGD